jgi:4-hydroxy-4-methyl-2-oxoglutarate aldolase
MTITRQRNFLRADSDQVKNLCRHTSSSVGDALGRSGGLGPAIRPLTPNVQFAGTALTVRCSPGDNLAALVALSSVIPGDVIVIACDRSVDAAIIGGNVAQWALQFGAVAIVTDGLLRDADELDALGLPIFAAGFHPNGPTKVGSGEIGQSITLEGVIIQSGDIILGDRDGVVVVPRGKVAKVIEIADTVHAAETDSAAAFNRGETPAWLSKLVSNTLVRDLGEPQ